MSEVNKSQVLALHSLERKVLPFVSLKTPAAIAQKVGISEAEAQSGLSMLEAKGYVTLTYDVQEFIGLDSLGKEYLTRDLPETVILKDIQYAPKKMSELPVKGSEFSSVLGLLKRNRFVTIEKKGELLFTITDAGKAFVERFSNPLKLFAHEIPANTLSAEQKRVVEQFSSRKKFIKKIEKRSMLATLTPKGEALLAALKELGDVELAEAVTSDMLKSGSWKGATFRPYDIHINVPNDTIARRHPMMEANNILRDVFVEMGFSEMQGPMVESAFWNMDTMWIPQDHPARDEQDTFYLEGKAKIPPELAEKTKKMHEEGIKRSHTKVGDWSMDIAQKRLLRTHSTATTFRTLAELGKEAQKTGKPVANGKYFYIANNFRNETVDATHLADFFQGEGFIIGDDLGLADLMGFIKEFYAKLGIHKIRFKPTYNPYTEPSMEAHYFDERLGKWYSLINSGIFRPETLEPLGITKPIIAWGMGASRVAALLTNATSMRDITGHTCDIEWLKHRPLMQRNIVRKQE